MKTVSVNTNRLPSSKREWINRNLPLKFYFEGRLINGFSGDTLASALVANGYWMISRSFKYHRPRGPVSFAGNEANTLVQVDAEPNVLADLRFVKGEESVMPQNIFGTLKNDRAAFLNWFSRFLPVGFYYRTFFGSDGHWDRWEPLIRKLSGLGHARALNSDTVRFDKQYLHCDVAVIGAGPAGLAAANAAAQNGNEVFLFERMPLIGGSLHYERFDIDPVLNEKLRDEWINKLEPDKRVSVFTSANVTGIFEDKLLSVVAGNRLLKVRASKIILANGGIDQFPVFPNNDLPGIALCSGLLRLIKNFRVSPGKQAVVITTDDAGYKCAIELIDSGMHVAALIDLRATVAGPIEYLNKLLTLGVDVISGVKDIKGVPDRHGRSVAGVSLQTISGRQHLFSCDVVAMSAGVVPAYTLAAQAGLDVQFQGGGDGFILNPIGKKDVLAVGIVAARHEIASLVQHAKDTAYQINSQLLINNENLSPQTSVQIKFNQIVKNKPEVWPIYEGMEGKAFVDLDEDLQPSDLRETVRLGFDNIQLLKRFSTAGMGPSQGRHSALATLLILGRATGKDYAGLGIATPRPPAGEESLAHIAGRNINPIRLTPLNEQHLRRGAEMMPVGSWLRPAYFGPKEQREICIKQEVQAVRQNVGVFDVGTLGGILLRGPDAAIFLERMYTGRFINMKQGMVRYALMTDDTGTIFDDGVVGLLQDQEFYLTTTTSHADFIYRKMLYWNAQWQLSLDVTNVTSSLCGINLAGPKSRSVLQLLCPEAELTNEQFGYMKCRTLKLDGVEFHAMRVGFLGELSYELHIPTSRASSFYEALMNVGVSLPIVPIGVEAQRLLRLEKGHVIVGQDTDGITIPSECGMQWAVADKPFFIGKRALYAETRSLSKRSLVCWQLPEGEEAQLKEGLLVLNDEGEITGYVTSLGISATLGRTIGMAYASSNMSVPGSWIAIKNENGSLIKAEVVKPPFYDPLGDKQKI